ncbi:hypothetical protein DVS28_a4349 [Euzebya pacifica]|uniref:Uncharacterized protein n=1 Tax=Euzebya pacifica TaxID=1608957 RepID=A0A346Y3G8_9ACTN|nr:hypothetical protein DVS28_a4349 [Euzebya pacifica]
MAERHPDRDGERLLVPVTGGELSTASWRAVVLGGVDRALRRPDGSMRLDVTLELRGDDAAAMTLRYHGIRVGDPAALRALEDGAPVSTGAYTLHVAGVLEHAGAPDLDARVVVGTGTRPPGGPVYDLHLLDRHVRPAGR